MAYLETQHTHKRLAGVTGVAAIHVALAFGLVAGLAITMEPPGPDTTIRTRDIPIPPPPVPDDVPPPPDDTTTPTVEDTYTPPVAPPVNIDLVDTGILIREFDFPPIGPSDPIVPRTREIGPRVIPRDPPPAFAPRGAVPNNGQGNWVTTIDYPRRALTRGWEGEVSYALEIGINGRVDNCRVTNSSGREVLDRAACRMIERRARFDPATDSTGAVVSGSYRGTVAWVIPEN